VKSFVAPNLSTTTTLTFRLTVSDATTSNSTDKTVSIVFTNDPPIAALNCPAGQVLTVDEGDSVTFSSAGSNDPEGGALSYLWTQNVGPPPLGIGGATTPSITFIAPHLGYLQLGGTSITLQVTDPLSASASKTCGLFINDVTAPNIFVPDDQVVEATSAAGAAVSYAASAQDAVEDEFPEPIACDPASGSTFPLDETTIVECTASDSNGNSATGYFGIAVQDTTAPTLTIPLSFGVEATSAAGAIANFPATANDVVDGAVTPDCTPATGSQFALGATPVSCTATDAHDNTSAPKLLTVNVFDTTKPVIAPHAPVVAEATKPQGADVAYTSPTWTDAVDGSGSANCLPASGSTFALGTTTVHCRVQDAAGNQATSSFTVQVRDTTPPELTVPANIVAEATSAAGAAVTFTPTATDAVDTSVAIVCTPASGSIFEIATTQVDCTATDDSGNHDEGNFDVTVRDTTPPTLTVPANIVAEATSAAGAVVTFTTSATDLVDDDVAILCTPASGSTFAIATTQVDCTATDDYGNHDDKSFDVKVQDTTPPAIAPHADILAVEATGPSGAPVNYTSPAWTDAVSGSGNANCLPASGSTFALGTNTVHCRAQDGAGNQATSTFAIQVVDKTPPTLALPSNITEEATGPTGAVATFTATANDIVSGNVPVTCVPASGSTFGLAAAPTKAKTTQVDCSATDGADNTATGSFNVTVQDTTAPSLTVPASFSVEATSAAGAIATFAASSSDVVDGIVGPDCNHASGDTFPLGNTTVTCSATDTRGNASASKSFVVSVVDTTGPVMGSHLPVTAIALANSGAYVNYDKPGATDAVDGNIPDGDITCTPASGSWFGMGATEVSCTAKDSRGNVSAVPSKFNVIVTYAFAGFYSPIDNLPTTNTVQAGQSIPVKFSLGGNQGMNIFAAGYPRSTVMTCGAAAQDAIEETSTAGSSTLQYDAGTGRYIYVWKTEKAWSGTCRQLQITFADGTTQRANFQFKK
jgi:hypothetical protein